MSDSEKSARESVPTSVGALSRAGRAVLAAGGNLLRVARHWPLRTQLGLAGVVAATVAVLLGLSVLSGSDGERFSREEAVVLSAALSLWDNAVSAAEKNGISVVNEFMVDEAIAARSCLEATRGCYTRTSDAGVNRRYTLPLGDGVYSTVATVRIVSDGFSFETPGTDVADFCLRHDDRVSFTSSAGKKYKSLHLERRPCLRS